MPHFHFLSFSNNWWFLIILISQKVIDNDMQICKGTKIPRSLNNICCQSYGSSSVFVVTYSDKTTTVVYEDQQKAMDNHRNTYGTTTKRHDSLTVALWIRLHPQATIEILNHLKFPWLCFPKILQGCIYGAITNHDNVLQPIIHGLTLNVWLGLYKLQVQIQYIHTI